MAADLLAQAEHDPLAQAILVTTVPRARASAVAAEIERQMASALARTRFSCNRLPRSRCIVVPDLDDRARGVQHAMHPST